MFLHTQRRQFGRRGLLGRLPAALAVCALVFAQLLPSIAEASGADGWIEICSESGVVLKQVDMGGNPAPGSKAPGPDCTICAFCLALDQTAVLSDPMAVPPRSERNARGGLASQTALANPAQFWAHHRGPPLAAEHIKGTGTDSTAYVLAKVSTLMTGGAPWT